MYCRISNWFFLALSCKISKYGCFAAGTPVYTDHGKESIENITISQKVLYYNEKTKTKEYRPVTALKTYIVSAILAIVFNAQDTLWATPNHPFWHKGHYVEASTLHAGDTIEALEGCYSHIQQIIPISGERRVYNITVAENSNYYVGSRGVLVHNDCFLKRLTDSPELMARIDALPDALKGQFIQDFYEAGEDVIKVLRERPGCVKAWEGLVNRPEWVRKNVNLLEKIANKSDDYIARVDLFYKNFKPAGPFPAIRQGINFNKHGFPDFSDYYAPINNKKFFREDLAGNGQNSPDFAEAANWFVANNPNVTLANGGKGIVVDGQYYAMHHMEDGKTIVPVLGTKHNEVGHTGGGSIIDKSDNIVNLRGLFEIP